MTIYQALAVGEELLSHSGVPDPRWNAERLLSLALQAPRAVIYGELQKELTAEALEAYQRLVRRRCGHEPLAYIEGTQEFFGREFHVSPEVLIPRPETEEIVRAALELSLPQSPRILDICSGSGCIAATLALEIPSSIVFALELSAPALSVLRRNTGSANGIFRGDMFALPVASKSIDLIVSNPPYVEQAEFDALPAETHWEPEAALLAASLEDVYGALLSAADRVLKSSGFLIFEIGFGQQARIEALCRKHTGLNLCSIRPDFRGILRACILQKT